MANTIFLNGCSSAGKTTLALKLQQLLPEPYQHIALDQYRDGMPMRVRGLNAPVGTEGALGLNVVPVEQDGEWVTQIQFGDYGERVLSAMRRSVALFSELGLPVIVDDLLFKPEYLRDYVRVLNPATTWFIGVQCALDVVNQRESHRPGRFPGTATSHFHQVHAHGEIYDLEVDTSAESPRQVAERIIDRLRAPPQAFARMRAAFRS
jgi:chloramphenicol 3-O phosphotransferase